MRWSSAGRSAAGLFLLLLTGCTSDQAHDLDVLLDVPGPVGFQTGPESVNGELSLDDAARATPIEAALVRGYLDKHGWRDGYSRVWTSKDGSTSFVTAVALRFERSSDADGLQALVEQEFSDVAPARLEPYPGIPGGRSYYFNLRDGSGKYQLCSGYLFTVTTVMHALSWCGTTPPDLDVLEKRAKDQYARSVAELHPRPSATGPNAGTPMSSPSTSVQDGSSP